MDDRPSQDMIDQIIGNYRIVAPIGIGGMGRVYRARHLHLEREVAIKLLHVHLAADETFRARFRQEAQAAARLEHPNIVRLYDYGEQNGQLYLIMELLTGGSLRTLLRERTAVFPAQSLRGPLDLILQTADGLAYAHARGMVHRDIKPDNLLLDIQTQPDWVDRYHLKIGDFGLARLAETSHLTASGVTLGTPAYMSPEQCQGGTIDHRSDLYSLGIVLYEVATGRVPFTAKTLSDAIYNHVYVAPPPPRSLRPDLPSNLEAIILRCLAKRPDDRFPTMEAFASALTPLLAGDDVQSVAVPNVPVSPVSQDHDAPPLPTIVDAAALDAGADAIPSPHVATPGVAVPRVYVFGADGHLLQTADLTGQGLTIGSLPNNDMVLTDPQVSRHQLLIDWNGSRATVTDLGSSSGTVLAGVTLPPRVAQPWHPDDDLAIGHLRLRLMLPNVVSDARVPAASPARPSKPAQDEEPRSPSGAVPEPITSPASGAVPPIRRRRTWIVAGVVVLVLVILAAYLVTRDTSDEPRSASAVDPSPTRAGEAVAGNTTPAQSPSTMAALATTSTPATEAPASTAEPTSFGSGAAPASASASSTVASDTAAPPCPDSPEGIYVYAADLLNDRIQKFDGRGNVVCSWSGDYVGDDDIARPGPIAVDSRNQFYVSNGGWIKVFDAQGRYQGRWGDGQVWPWDMAFARDDMLYVLDGGQGKVFTYTADGALRSEWGSPGSADGQLASATGIAVDDEGRVYISDRNNHRVQVFDVNGNLLAIWQPKDETGANLLSFPGGIAVDETGNVYVAVIRVAKLDQQGTVVAMLGEPDDIVATSELEIAADGTLYGIESINQRINWGTTTGELLGSWGSSGAALGQFDGLADIAVSTR